MLNVSRCKIKHYPQNTKGIFPKKTKGFPYLKELVAGIIHEEALNHC